jgi:hypothetical protein
MTARSGWPPRRFLSSTKTRFSFRSESRSHAIVETAYPEAPFHEHLPNGRYPAKAPARICFGNWGTAWETIQAGRNPRLCLGGMSVKYLLLCSLELFVSCLSSQRANAQQYATTANQCVRAYSNSNNYTWLTYENTCNLSACNMITTAFDS